MSRKPTKPLVDLASGATLDDLVAAAQGRSIQLVLETSMRYADGELHMVCAARPLVAETFPSGRRSFVPLCMPFVGDTWAEVLTPLGAVLDEHKWSDVGVAS